MKLAASSFALAALPVFPVAAPARAVQGLPPITVSATDLRVGTELTVSGTGCLDAESGSGEGRRVIVSYAPRGNPDDYLTYSVYRGSGPPFLDVKPDGTWGFTTTIQQPLPPMPSDLVARCLNDPNRFNDQTIYEPVEVTVTLPALGGVQVLGETVTFDNPCELATSVGASYLYEGDRLVATLTDATADAAATTVSVTVPEQVPNGTYRLVATCYRQRQGQEGSFAATISYQASTSSLAPAAAPVQGSPSFTG